MKRLLIISIALLACVCGQSVMKHENARSLKNIHLIPVPFQLEVNEGSFMLTPGTRIVSTSTDSTSNQVEHYFADIVRSSTGYDLRVESGQSGNDLDNAIVFHIIQGDTMLGNEGYELNVTPQRVDVSANTPAGLFYGVQTILQLLPPEIYRLQKMEQRTDWLIPCVHILDKPRYSWRGMHLDVCRHFFPKEYIKRYIDFLAHHKMNRFHWHLTEDQGWRIEIKKYPKLTEIGAWRASREGITWRDREPQQPGEKADYGGFYTQNEIREIIEYARRRFITIIPEIEMPGHSIAALAAYPQYSCSGGPVSVATGGSGDVNDVYCAGNDSTLIFLENILSEVIDLFPGKYMHIGGDEVHKAHWEKCPQCQKRIKKEDLKDEDELQSDFIRRIEKFVNSRGKKIIGWDEILEGGLAPGATVMSWRGTQGGIEAARMGHDVIMTPREYCYFNYYQRDPRDEPEANGGYLTLEIAYGLEPTPEELTPEQADHVLGAQGNLWTEYIDTPARVEYMLFPRLCALSEVVWSPAQRKDFQNFSDRLMYHYFRLDAMDVKYCAPQISGFAPYNVFLQDMRFEIVNPRPYGKIRYTLDGTEPTQMSAVYKGPVRLTQTSTLKTKIYFPNGTTSRTKQALFEKCVPRKPVYFESAKPGLLVEYYKVKSKIKSTLDLKTQSPWRTGTIDQFKIPEDAGDQLFGLIYSGYIRVPASGIYNFITNSDDGSRLYIGDRQVLDNDGNHAAADRTGPIALEEGTHPIRLEYFQGKGLKHLEVFYEGPGISRREIPASALLHIIDEL